MNIETLPEPTTTVKSGKYGPFNQTKREVQTRWVLNPESETKVVVDLFTSHRSESKTFSTTLTWATVQPKEGPFSVETWSSDNLMVTISRESVARYSVKAMEAHHAEALAVVEEYMPQPTNVAQVFEEAAAAVLPEEA